MSWENARKHCVSLGGDLTSISDQAENNKIVALIDQSGIDELLWIGANDLRKEGTFTWSDGKAFAFSNWNPGEPNNYRGAEDCVHFHIKNSERRWNDYPCSIVLGFICKLLA